MSNFNISKISGNTIQSYIQKINVNGPDWEKFPHKGMERPPEAEFDGLIDNLAKELAKANFQNDSSQYESLSSEGDKLKAQYISVVSPDRKTMAKNASEMINQYRSKAKNKESEKPLNLIDYLNKKDGIGEYHDTGMRRYITKSGTTVDIYMNDIEQDSYEIKDSMSGQPVMGYNSNGWSIQYTPQEQSMHLNFVSKLTKAENRYYKQYVDGDSLSIGQEMEPSTEQKNRVDYLA